ncbi:hypothetical protein [Rhodopseudomonas sp.]|uniref:hypothetical protein n=1 Tax=Rhodopseudomonas sp. TaxID=1078 RepID=UPI003B3B6EA5
MANYALIKIATGEVVNRIILDDEKEFPAQDGHKLQLDLDDTFAIGGMFIAGSYTPPPSAPMPATVPVSASRLGLMRAWKEQGVWDQIKAKIAADPETQEEWDVAIEIRRTDPLVQQMIAVTGMSELDVDALLIRANELVA